MRRDHDAYLTPQPLADAIVQRVAHLIPAPKEVLEPSAGEGAFCRAVRATWAGASVTAVEPRPFAAGKVSVGALHVQTLEQFHQAGCVVEAGAATPRYTGPRFDLAIGNPPFSLAESHIRLCCDVATTVAFLLRMSFLASQGRVKSFWENQRGFSLRWLIPLAQRPSFTGTGTDNSEYAVFVWQKNFGGQAAILPHLWVR